MEESRVRSHPNFWGENFIRNHAPNFARIKSEFCESPLRIVAIYHLTLKTKTPLQGKRTDSTKTETTVNQQK